MKKLFVTITLLLVLLVGNLFANPAKSNYSIIKLNPSDFTSTGDDIDEVFYWGKTDGIIKIPKENIEQFLNSEVDK